MEDRENLDQKILELLKNDARMPYSEIGEKLHISRVAVSKHVEAMKKEGVIQGFKTIVAEENEQNAIRFFLDVESYPEHFQEVQEQLCRNPLIRKLYMMTGESRMHAIGLAPTKNTLSAFAKYLLNANQGIRHMECNIAMCVLKDADGGVGYECDGHSTQVLGGTAEQDQGRTEQGNNRTGKESGKGQENTEVPNVHQ